jgi:hypothetical protein
MEGKNSLNLFQRKSTSHQLVMGLTIRHQDIVGNL